jgi:hypothetical protein
MKNGIMKRPVEQIVSQETNNPLDLPTAEFKSGLDRRKANRKVLMEWIKSSLVKDHDYGSIMIKGVQSKPSLFKPGAERICGMLSLIPCFPNLDKYEELAISGKEIKTIILKCNLTNQNGTVVASGIGARMVEMQDQGNLNKALKMAAKSAVIDATLRCAGVSQIFSQDLEDMQFSEPDKSDDELPFGNSQSDSEEPASPRQLSTIADLVDNPFINDEERLKLSNALEHDISKSDAKEILNYFLGESKFIDGSWVKVKPGVIEERQSELPE